MKKILGCLVLLLAMNAQAQTCGAVKNKPDTQYELLNGGAEVKDLNTGLIWQRCQLGSTWNGTTCEGSVVQYTWNDAFSQATLMASSTGLAWRLPNIKELTSLVDTACSQNAINETIFPKLSVHWKFWSSSGGAYGGAYGSDQVWVLHVEAGYTYPWGKDNSFLVRLVRGE